MGEKYACLVFYSTPGFRVTGSELVFNNYLLVAQLNEHKKKDTNMLQFNSAML